MPIMKWITSLLLALSLVKQVGAADTPSVPPHIAAEIASARLAGDGNYRWFGLKIYEAQLWVGKQGYDAQHPSLSAFALDLHYARAFEGKRIAGKSAEEMEKLGFGSDEQRRLWLLHMESCFPNVEEGTHLTGIFEPGTGVRYYRDGKPICDIRDRDFAFAFFAIWLDAHTSAKSLRDALLSKASAP